MASLLCRSVGAITRRTALYVSARTCMEAPLLDPAKGKVAQKEREMPDSLGQSVGPERWELLTRTKGNRDPFEMNIVKLEDSSIDNPNIIPTTDDRRMVGCVCEEDDLSVNWMSLNAGESKRCECGHWFKLQLVSPSAH